MTKRRIARLSRRARISATGVRVSAARLRTLCSGRLCPTVGVVLQARCAGGRVTLPMTKRRIAARRTVAVRIRGFFRPSRLLRRRVGVLIGGIVIIRRVRHRLLGC